MARGGGWPVVPPGAVAAGEPQLLVRGGEVLAPRLARIPPRAEPEPGGPGPGGPVWDAGGVVLVTGGTGGLGGVVARHLVARHGVRELVLVRRRGVAAVGAAGAGAGGGGAGAVASGAAGAAVG